MMIGALPQLDPEPTMPTSILTACLCILGAAAPCDSAAEPATPPDRLIDAICDASLAMDARAKYLRSLEDYGFYMAFIHQLGRLGDERSLRLLLRHQSIHSRLKKSRIAVPIELHRLSSKLKVDVWENIHPLYRVVWLRRGYGRVDGPELEGIPGEEPLRVYRNTFTPETVERLRSAAKTKPTTPPATPGCAANRACRRP